MATVQQFSNELASMLVISALSHRGAPEVLYRALQIIKSNSTFMEGIIVLLVGDSNQTLLAIFKGSKAEGGQGMLQEIIPLET